MCHGNQASCQEDIPLDPSPLLHGFYAFFPIFLLPKHLIRVVCVFLSLQLGRIPQFLPNEQFKLRELSYIMWLVELKTQNQHHVPHVFSNGPSTPDMHITRVVYLSFFMWLGHHPHFLLPWCHGCLVGRKKKIKATIFF